MTREEYLRRNGDKGRALKIIPQSKFDWLSRYKVYKKEIAKGRNNMEALFIVSEECCCDYITAYKSVSFFINLKTKKEK